MASDGGSTFTQRNSNLPPWQSRRQDRPAGRMIINLRQGALPHHPGNAARDRRRGDPVAVSAMVRASMRVTPRLCTQHRSDRCAASSCGRHVAVGHNLPTPLALAWLLPPEADMVIGQSTIRPGCERRGLISTRCERRAEIFTFLAGVAPARLSIRASPQIPHCLALTLALCAFRGSPRHFLGALAIADDHFAVPVATAAGLIDGLGTGEQFR